MMFLNRDQPYPAAKGSGPIVPDTQNIYEIMEYSSLSYQLNQKKYSVRLTYFQLQIKASCYIDLIYIIYYWGVPMID